MVIINTKGGLGNQMLQYALYLTMKNAGKSVKICTEHFDWAISEKRKLIQPHGKKFLVESIFNTKGIRATPQEVRRLSTVRMDFVSRARRKLGLEKKTHLFEEKMNNPRFELLMALDNVFLDGYWQRFDYFAGAERLIKNEYTFTHPLTGRNAEIAHKIKGEMAVSIHVRRNDYLTAPAYVIQDEAYYQKAMCSVSASLPNPVFYCFSDDVEWCRENLASLGYEIIFVDWNSGDESYRDMQLMSMCKANIITNSTFSMWAAWLNADKDKIVIRPKHYYTDRTADEQFFWPADWQTV